MSTWLLLFWFTCACVLSQQLTIRGGSIRDASRDVPLLKKMGASHARLYAMWRYLEPRVDNTTINQSLTVDFVRQNPALIDEWTSSPNVSWTWLDNTIATFTNLSLIPIVEIAEGTFSGLPIWTPTGQVADPNVIGRECYLATQYLVSRAIVRRYRSVVHLWQIENELNEAFASGFGGQRLLNLSETNAWRDWTFLESLLRVLREAVKTEDPSALVTQNVHTDLSEALHQFLGLPGFYLDAVRAWAPLLDFISFDAYPNYFSPDPALGSLVGARVSAIKKLVPDKMVVCMETGFPVNSPLLTDVVNVPASANFSETAQAEFMQVAYKSIADAGGDGMLVFGTWPSTGILPVNGTYQAGCEGPLLAAITSLYLRDEWTPLTEWILDPANLECAFLRGVPLIQAIGSGWGIFNPDNTPRLAVTALTNLFQPT